MRRPGVRVQWQQERSLSLPIAHRTVSVCLSMYLCSHCTRQALGLAGSHAEEAGGPALGPAQRVDTGPQVLTDMCQLAAVTADPRRICL